MQDHTVENTQGTSKEPLQVFLQQDISGTEGLHINISFFSLMNYAYSITRQHNMMLMSIWRSIALQGDGYEIHLSGEM